MSVDNTWRGLREWMERRRPGFREALLAHLRTFAPGVPNTAAELTLDMEMPDSQSYWARVASRILHSEWRSGRIGAVEEWGPRGGRGFYVYGPPGSEFGPPTRD